MNRQWKWSEDAKCFICGDFDQPPKYFCLGERMVYAHYGLDSYGVVYRGSTIGNWGGYDWGYDLKKALEWIHAARYTDLAFKAWTTHGSMVPQARNWLSASPQEGPE